MRDDRDAEREHQDEIADGLRREPCSGPPDGCGAAGGFGPVLLPRRMAGARADDDPCCERNQHEKCERAYDRGDQPADIASVVATGR